MRLRDAERGCARPPAQQAAAVVNDAASVANGRAHWARGPKNAGAYDGAHRNDDAADGDRCAAAAEG